MSNLRCGRDRAQREAPLEKQGAQLGFDFLWVEMEHSPVSHETLRQIVLATRGLPAVPFARPAVNELWTIKRFLDTGVLGIITPFTRTPEDARRLADGCRYPPRGLRGCGSDLAAIRWRLEREIPAAWLPVMALAV